MSKIEELNAQFNAEIEELKNAATPEAQGEAQTKIDAIKAEIKEENAKEKSEIIVLTSAEQITTALEKGGVDIFDALEDLDDENFVSLKGEYFKMQPNKNYNIIVIGYDEMNNKFFNPQLPEDARNAKKVPVLTIKVKENGKAATKITAEAVLIYSMKPFADKMPVAVRVTTGDQKISPKTNFKYLDMEVSVLLLQETKVEEATGEVVN